MIWLALGLAACSSKDTGTADSSENGDRTPPLDPIVLPYTGWSYVLPELDPLYAHDDTAEPCPSVGYGAENGFFEVETDYCAIATFRQAITGAVSKGEVLHFVVWNLDLWAPEPYDAQRLLRMGSTELWSDVVRVPGNEDVSEIEVVVSEDMPAGTEAWFHLRNHGVNSWRLGDVERAP